jgi:hypothetical protein
MSRKGSEIAGDLEGQLPSRGKHQRAGLTTRALKKLVKHG